MANLLSLAGHVKTTTMVFYLTFETITLQEVGHDFSLAFALKDPLLLVTTSVSRPWCLEQALFH